MTRPRYSAPLLAAVGAAVLLAAPLRDLASQSLSSRVNGAPDGAVQFSFPARAGVCGNGRTYISTGPGNFYGSWTSSELRASDPCQTGPVRVVLGRVDRQVVDVNTYVGPPSTAPGVTDLGTVSASEGADYLLGIAAKAEGRPSRDAILPALLADGANVSAPLLAIARDQARPRETRRSAISWLARVIDERNGGGAQPAQIVRAFSDIARDEEDNQQVRQHAMATLSRLENGDGVPALVELSRGASDSWLSKQALQALARSGDPRARQFLRTAVARTDLADDIRATIARGIGGEYATGADAAALRDLYAKTDGEKTRDAIMNSLAEMGGSENARWLMAIARDENESLRNRRRAIQLADRAGVPTAELVSLYDRVKDPQVRESLLAAYTQLGTKQATDKLLSIAKTETDYTLRRRAISYMSRSDDPRVKDALKEIVEKP